METNASTRASGTEIAKLDQRMARTDKLSRVVSLAALVIGLMLFAFDILWLKGPHNSMAGIAGFLVLSNIGDVFKLGLAWKTILVVCAVAWWLWCLFMSPKDVAHLAPNYRAPAAVAVAQTTEPRRTALEKLGQRIAFRDQHPSWWRN